MNWNDPNLERRASTENPDYSDRINAQREINWQKRQNQITELQNQGYDLNPNTGSLFKGLGGYIGLIFVFAITTMLLLDPTQVNFASLRTTDSANSISPLSLWTSIAGVIFIMLFISVSMINRGRERFFTKIRKRFTFCLITSILITVILAVRINLS